MDYRIERALKFMGAHCELRITVPLIAGYFGLSRSRFEHLFKHDTGTNVRDGLREIRMARGCRLLADVSLRIKEIAVQCGYSTTSSFTRAFEKRFGVSPSRFRRLLEHAPQPLKARAAAFPLHAQHNEQTHSTF